MVAVVALVAALCVALTPARAVAFSTRVHIAIANDLRQWLIDSGGTAIPLAFGDHRVLLTAEDAEAIIEHPLEFRAGAVGPDAVFPAMTDPTHAIGMRPFEQCELLYAAAVTPEERAFAMGCFVHGASDAIAHHFVNYLTGETFTFTPVTAGRAEEWDNVVRHIVAELMIQKALLKARPDAFEPSELYHTFPAGFVARIYFAETSPAWQIFSVPAVAKLDAYMAAHPDAQLREVIADTDLTPGEHASLLPMYIRLLDQQLVMLRDTLTARIAYLQDPTNPEGAELEVSAGPDGQLGTPDDDTACSVGCPNIYAQYITYVSLLAPRHDGDGDPLPSAFDEIRKDLSGSLHDVASAYVATLANLSTLLNKPIDAGTSGLGITAADIETAMAPLRAWVTEATTIDYETIMQAVVPEWLLAIDRILQEVNIKVADVIKLLFQPAIDEAKAIIEAYVIERARVYLTQLTERIEAEIAMIEAEYTAKLQAGAAPGISGTVLDSLFDSGLYGYAFNLSAASLAEHDVVLVPGAGADGPATFDASFTPEWTRAAACTYLQPAIFPLGLGINSLLSVRSGGTDFIAAASDDSPWECHDGSLTGFAATPSAAACALTNLADLRQPPHVGSLTRSYPPDAVATAVECNNLVVPGLPEPPPHESGGCCEASRAGRSGATTTFAMLMLVVTGFTVRRRRRRRTIVATIALVGLLGLVLAGCGETPASGPEAGGDAGPGGSELLDALGSSTWHAMVERDGKPRASQIELRARSLLWGELTNPYGPARERKMRSFQVADDGRSITSTVITPNGWPIPVDNGREESWTVQIMGNEPGSRQLQLERDGVIVTYDEGPWPAPDSGLTAAAYAFNAGGAIDDAFCNSGTGGFNYERLFDAARGRGGEQLLGTELVAGVPLLPWVDQSGGNNFAITDVPGFDRLGGTKLTNQFNFIVTYRGELQHPGGLLAMREQNDSVEDGLWVFLLDAVGNAATDKLFLEVHGFTWPDNSSDEPDVALASGPVPIEAILIRCSEAIEEVNIQIRQGNGGFMSVGEAPSQPHLDPELFPPLF